MTCSSPVSEKLPARSRIVRIGLAAEGVRQSRMPSTSTALHALQQRSPRASISAICSSCAGVSCSICETGSSSPEEGSDCFLSRLQLNRHAAISTTASSRYSKRFISDPFSPAAGTQFFHAPHYITNPIAAQAKHGFLQQFRDIILIFPPFAGILCRNPEWSFHFCMALCSRRAGSFLRRASWRTNRPPPRPPEAG